MFGLDGIAIADVVVPPEISCADATPPHNSAVPATAAIPDSMLANFMFPPMISSVAPGPRLKRSADS